MATKRPVGSSKKLQRHNSSFGLQVQSIPIKSAGPKTVRARTTKTSTSNSHIASDNNQKGGNKAKPEYDEDAEKQFNAMLAGTLNNLPNVPRSVVRIFLSSTFSDMRAERNALVQTVAPKLKEFCSQYDLDFQLVDMRWGVTDDSQNDHTVEKICLLEVENCKKISLGTNFVLILGNRFGFRPIPTEIDIDEYNAIIKYVDKSEDVKLVNKWYSLDKNSCPPQHILQPIRSEFTFFGDYSPGCDTPRAKDTENWQKTFDELQRILRKAANQAFTDKKISKKQYDQYIMSVTDSEIMSGIIEAADPSSHTLVYRRDLYGLIDSALSQKNANRYTNILQVNGKVTLDQAVEDLKDEMYEKVKKHLGGKNVKDYPLPWREGGVDPSQHKEHDKYIENICSDIFSDVTGQVQTALDNYMPKIRLSQFYTDYHELIHHLTFCRTKCETFCGQTDVLEKVKDYVLHDTTRKPLVLHAPSGAGKTSIMAMIMNSLPKWFGKKKHVGMIRFLGTSPKSTNIYDVMYGVAGQLADNAEMIMEPVMYKNMEKLNEYMPRFLRRVAFSLKIPIVVLLDSLDQLSPAHDAHSVLWLPSTLPSNIRFIVSTLPEEHGILQNLTAIYQQPECFVKVPLLSTSTGREITTSYLEKKDRTVTDLQIKLLLQTFERSPGPLFLKLLLDQAVKWNSYTPEHELVLANSVKEAISQLFETLETKFGQVVTSRALGYITIGLSGISETEIEDVLSCDDEALDDVYRYHNPPVEGIVRIPPVIWARIRYDLKEYLVERRSFNKYTLNWYHRQFIETAKARYASGKDCEKLHATMAELFMSEKGIKRSIELKWRKLKIENADRHVTPQPVTSRNSRLLACLPYHITHAGTMVSLQTAKEKCFCNFNFLKSKVFNISSLVEDMNSFIEKREDHEVQKLRNFLSVSKVDMSNHIRLAVNMLAYIEPDEEHVCLKQMLKDARAFLDSRPRPILIPRYHCLASRRDTSAALLDTVKNCEGIIGDSNESVLLELLEDGSDPDQDKHALYNAVSEELQYVGLPRSFKKSCAPRVDRAGKRIIYYEDNSLNVFNTSTTKTTTKSLEDITGESKKKKPQPVITSLSSDSSQLAILFTDSDLLVVDVGSLKTINSTTLKNDSTSVFSIFCGSSEKEVVIICGKSDDEKDNEKGFLNVWFTGSQKPGKKSIISKTLANAFSKGMVGIGALEDFIVGAANSETQGTITSLELDTLDQVSEITLEHPIKQLVVSKSKFEAAVLTSEGVASIVNCRKGEVKHHLPINDSVTYLNACWLHKLAVLGDDQGKMTLFNVKTGEYMGSFLSHKKGIEKITFLDDHIISLGKNNEMKVWSLSALYDDIKESHDNDNKEKTSDLLSLMEITSVDLTLDGKEIIVASQNKSVEIWSVENLQMARKHDVGMVINKMEVVSDRIYIALETSTGTLKLFDIKSGSKAASDVPRNVVDFAVSQDMSTLCAVCQKDNGLMVDLYDLNHKKQKKSFFLKKGLTFETLDISLNASGRFLILRTKCTPEEFKEIEISWKKMGSFLPQPHPYRFTAVDLTQATGGLMPCLRTMSKIPHLGEVVHQLQGNVVLVTTRRWVLFWDIPTGKCDQKVSKVEKKGQLYRPDWLGQTCKGTSKAITMTKDGALIAVGSDDGYVFVYHTDSGLPVGKKCPSSKHSAPVTAVVASPDSRWIVSACRNNTIKVWETDSGKEVFSTRVNSEVVCMKFSKDSETLVVSTGSHVTRLLVYKLHTGQ